MAPGRWPVPLWAASSSARWGWQWIFWINIPAGIIAIAAAQVILDKSLFIQDAPGRKYDWLGAALSVGILITFLLAMTNGQRAGWLGLPILAGLVGSGAFLAVFIWWELHISYPMLDLRLFKQRLFSLGVSAAFLSFLGMSSVRFLMPFYLQTVMGYSPGQVGLILIPNALCMILIRPLSGRLSDLYGWRKFNVGGLALSTAGLFILSRVTETSPLGLVMGGMILQSSGMATFGSPNQSSIFAGIERRSYGVVSALLSLVRNSANVTSIALATAIVAAVMVSMGHPPSLAAVAEAPGAFTAGLRTAFLAMGIILMAGVLVSFLKGDRAKAIREATPRRT